MRAGAQPYGARLRLPTRVKIKGLNVVPKASDITVDPAGWGPMWNTFDWAGWIKPQIDLAITQGANTVKVTGSGATASYPSQSVFQSRMRQFLDYCLSSKLFVYWNYASSDWGGSVATATPFLQAVVGVLSPYPNVIAIDCANEIGLFGITLANAQSLCQVGKAAGSLPVTGSLSCNSAAAFTDGTASGIAPYVDFMDFHPYFDTGDPSNNDWATYRAATYYKPWLIGECGKQNTLAASIVQSRWTALGQISNLAADCFGVVGFSITDYDTNQFGMYPATLTGARSQQSVPFSAWPGRQ